MKNLQGYNDFIKNILFINDKATVICELKSNVLKERIFKEIHEQ